MKRTESLSDLPLDLLRRYLVATGWTAKAQAAVGEHRPLKLLNSRGGGKRDYEIFLKPNPNTAPIELVVPKSLSQETSARVQSALEILEVVEERSLDEVARDVLTIGFDVLSSRLPNEANLTESILLSSALEYMGKLRSLLASAATTELHPAPFYGRTRKEAAAYADRCMFGHTFRGSFGFTVQSPLSSPRQNLSFFDPEPPFERRVVQRLSQALADVANAVRTNQARMSANSGAVIFSANGYDLLADLIREAGNNLNLSISLSLEWTSDAQVERVSSFSMFSEHADFARETARSLRAAPISQTETISGPVTTLRNETNPAQLMEDAESREVWISWFSEDHGDLKVRVALNASDYLRAVEAHRTGRRVTVSGVLERIGARWFLRSPTGFRVGSEPPATSNIFSN